jgi:4-aminobutyrate aminotransferase-like enzyme
MLSNTARRGFASYTEAQALKLLANKFSPAVPRSPKNNNIVCETAKGCWVTDVTGRKFLDCATGIGVASTGHSHPR